MARTKAPSPGDDGYEKYRQSQADISRRRSATGREIGEIPAIVDIERRESCRHDLARFCTTYNPLAFPLPFSAAHRTAISRIEEAVGGSLFAFAMARGSGKSTLSRMGALWAVSYAHVRYAYLIGATNPKAKATLDALRKWIRYLDLYALDFPEVSYPAQKLAGIANRAGGQTCNGESTLIEWSGAYLALPTVPPPPNWPPNWPLRADGKVPTSGCVLNASGLTGEGLRGSLVTLTTGEQVRPDVVLLDDPQTPKSARSAAQNEARLSLVSADVLGMAGPGQKFGAVMPCTVIEVDDMVDQVLDRTKHPMWRGERSGILVSMPTYLERWDPYFEIYARCAQLDPADFTESNAYFIEHQVELEEGAVASWPERFTEKEVSAIQNSMHWYFRDSKAFWAEGQNRPLARVETSAAALTPELVAAKASNLPRGVVPRTATRITAAIDMGMDLVWWMVVAWDEKFGGTLIDHGVYPDQNRLYFSKSDPRPSLQNLPAVKGQGEDAALYAALTAAAGRVFRPWRQEETGAEFHVSKCLVDANYGPKTHLVYEWCARSPHASNLIPSHGKYFGPTTTPISAWPLKPGERKGPGGNWWRISPTKDSKRNHHIIIDTNAIKSFAADRLRAPFGAPGCLSLFAPPLDKHKLLADHLTAEYPVELKAKDAQKAIDVWQARPGRDNDWFDTLVYNVVAASVDGLVWSPAQNAGAPPPPPPPPPVKWSEVQRQRDREKGL
jgi:hypothetical protein